MMETQNAFLMFANSLKLIRRAEIEHEGENIIDEIVQCVGGSACKCCFTQKL